MPTIAYQTVADYQERIPASDWPQVILICGEEMLCKKALEAILDTLVPPPERGLALEQFDGSEESIGSVLTSLNTFALLSRGKVVVVHDARLFYSGKVRQGLGEKMAQAARSGEMKKASRAFLMLMALNGLAFDDLADPDRRGKLVEDDDGVPPTWFSQLVDYCREKALTVPDKQDDAALLNAALEKGFPDGHRLILTTDFVDRRKALFKAIESAGLVVDCAVPKGASRTDRMAQDAVMQTAIDNALAKASMRMDGNARKRLIEWTGFDLRMLDGNVEKVINFVGKRGKISEADVCAVLDRTRKDPIFEFTNALADKDLPAALSFMKRLLDDGMHPLQLLAAAVNQIRRLLLAKDFITRDGGRTWSGKMTFAQFKSVPFKAVLADDENFALFLEKLREISMAAKGSDKGGKGLPGDLVLARNPKSPFPVFQTFKKAEAFSLEGLVSAMTQLSEADLRMKTTRQDPQMLLESVLVGICRGWGDGTSVGGVSSQG